MARSPEYCNQGRDAAADTGCCTDHFNLSENRSLRATHGYSSACKLREAIRGNEWHETRGRLTFVRGVLTIRELVGHPERSLNAARHETVR
jgi:hypothetical protein